MTFFFHEQVSRITQPTSCVPFFFSCCYEQKGPRVPFPVVHSLPGFSGCFKDAGSAQAPSNVDELADLTILGGRLQKEKLQIQEEAKAQRIPVIAVRRKC